MKRLIELAERWLRHGLVYPVLGVLFRNKVSSRPIDLGMVNRIIIFRFDRIGDMIVTTPIFRALKKNNANVQIAVLASSVNQEIPLSSPLVDDVYVLEKGWLGLIKQIRYLRRQRYDVLLNFVFNRTTSPGILANLIAPNGFKVGQGPEKYSFYFNRLLNLPRFDHHMADTLTSYIELVFGITVPEDQRRLELPVSQNVTDFVDRFLAEHGIRRRLGSRVQLAAYGLLNLSVKDANRKFSAEQVSRLASHISATQGIKIVLLVAPGDQETELMFTTNPELSAFPVYAAAGADPLGQLASIVEGAQFVVTMDTSLVHFASAMQTPVLALYTEPSLQKEWGPYRVQHAMLLSPTGKGISGIPVDDLVEKTDEFLASLKSTGKA